MPITLSRAEAIARAKSIEGFLYDSEVEFLYDNAASVTGRGVIVEVGSWKGKSTTALAAGAIASGTDTPVYAVDTFRGSPEHQGGGPIDNLPAFQHNLAGLADRVCVIRATSLDAAREFHEPIELLFIDADHSYEAVRADFDAWMPHVIPGGIIALHDTASWYGPKRVTRESVYRKLSSVRMAGSITAAFNDPPADLLDWLRFAPITTKVRLAEGARFLAHRLHLPKPIRQAGLRLMGRT